VGSMSGWLDGASRLFCVCVTLCK